MTMNLNLFWHMPTHHILRYWMLRIISVHGFNIYPRHVCSYSMTTNCYFCIQTLPSHWKFKKPQWRMFYMWFLGNQHHPTPALLKWSNSGWCFVIVCPVCSMVTGVLCHFLVAIKCMEFPYVSMDLPIFATIFCFALPWSTNTSPTVQSKNQRVCLRHWLHCLAQQEVESTSIFWPFSKQRWV